MSTVIRNSIRHHRRLAGMTQSALAALIDVDGSTVSKWESETVSVPDVHKIRLAAVLDAPVADLFDFTIGRAELQTLIDLEGITS